MKNSVLRLTFLLALVASCLSKADSAIPIIVVPASEAYCVDKFRFDLKSQSLDGLFKLFEALKPVLEEDDSLILFADWLNASSLQVLHPISCEESVGYSNNIRTAISKVMKLEVGGHERTPTSSYVMTEHQYKEIKRIADLFSVQSKYKLMDCVARIDAEYTTDTPLRLERSSDLAQQIIGAQAHLGFPALFVNVDDGNTYVLFHEGCDQRVELLQNLLFYLSLKNDDTKVHDLVVREAVDENLMMQLFY